MRRVLAVVSDVHAGSTVAVCIPEPITLPDGGSYSPSTAQRWLYQNWLDFWGQVKKAKRGADWFGVLCNGDLVDGDHHGTPQIASRDMNVQMWLLKKLFTPVLALKPDMMAVVRGTEAHVGKGASVEESFARHVAKETGIEVPQQPDTEMYSWWHYKGLLGDVRLDAGHHGRMGGRPWTKAGVVGTLATQIVTEHANRGESPPHLAFRSHFHTYFDTHGAAFTRLIQTPAWQLHTSYAYRVVPEVLSDIGGIIVIQEDGKPLEVKAVLYKPKETPTVKMG